MLKQRSCLIPCWGYDYALQGLTLCCYMAAVAAAVAEERACS